ncbi:response regulator [Candidatus Magnetomonas plexicatena]|uniref:response regulator n=1 Tax=Candidatus Magnetomonas plexicatena TaxID=2552947 RepID=UPI001C797B6D|nr:response regulator [Nitrospirales bacterium LBB_01]
MRILIADDDFAIRTLLQQFLGDYGEVDAAVSGAQAVDFFKSAMENNNPYNIIFLDVIMPEMNGLQALESIRNKEQSLGITPGNEVKIVMATALNSPKDVLDAYYIGGCNNYITKPFDFKKIAEMLKKHGFSKE